MGTCGFRPVGNAVMAILVLRSARVGSVASRAVACRVLNRAWGTYAPTPVWASIAVKSARAKTVLHCRLQFFLQIGN